MPGGLSGGGMLKLRFDWYVTTTVNHLKVPLCILKFVLLPNWHKLQKFLTSDTILNALWKEFGGKIVEFRPYNMFTVYWRK